MQMDNGPRGISRFTVVMTATVFLGALVSGCGDDADGVRTSASTRGEDGRQKQRVLWVGDSIAGVEGPALKAALTKSGVEFKDMSSDGGGTVVQGDEMSSRLAEPTWKALDRNLSSFRPQVVAYQITTYDWGTAGQQRASYEKLAGAARDAHAQLVIVSAPPFKLDDFYRQHARAIESAPKVAAQVARDSDGRVRFFDAAQLWGTDSKAAKAQRSSDGIHSCQQGSAAFAAWFTGKLSKSGDFTAADPGEWANGAWTEDEHFDKLGCA
ncbi:SGNH/GDSL hydrolase family protein [Streptomyces sp. MMBL 11-3]|uniref:SGNH/GDSL hydrolase family protein n=1 Tax=Streptomyces sp. MMBL 11-3 TaxID=3382639 RepID=UPI0039B64AE6